MKLLLINTLIVFCLLTSITTFAHYGPRGLTGGTITCGTHYNGIAYVGTADAGVFESTNATLVAWRLRAVGLKSGKITALTHSGSDLYTATIDSGIYIFNGYVGTDRYWNQRNNGLSNQSILSLVAVDTNTILAGSNGSGLFKTTNKGLSWTAVNSSVLNGATITALVKCGSRVVALVNNDGVFASDDNGDTWFNFNDVNTAFINNSECLSYNDSTDELMVSNNNGLFILGSASTVSLPLYTPAQTNLPSGTTIVNLSNNGSNWYIASTTGVFTSSTSAINWSSANTGLPTNNVGAVVAMPNALLAGCHKSGMFKSTVSGINWAANNTGMTNINVYSLACKGDSIVVAATEYGITVSTSIGNNPVIANTGLTDSLNVNDVEFAGNLLFAATKNAGVFVSSNLGQSWTAQNSGLTNMNIIRIICANGQKFAIDADGKVFQSDYLSTTWTLMITGLPSNPAATSIAVYANQIILGTYGNGVYIKHRDSTSWTVFNTGLTDLNVTAVTASDGKVFAGTDGSGVYVTDIDTASWSATNPITSSHFNIVPLGTNQINHIQYMTTVKGYVLASFKGGIVASHDNGISWDEAGNQFNLPSYTDHHKIGFVTSRLFVTTEKNSVQANGMTELPIIDTILAVHDQVVNAPAAGITSYHTVTSNINWQIVSSDPWLTLSVDSGLWNQHIWLQAATNTGAPRTGTVTLSGGSIVETITVNQDGSAPTEVNLHTLEAAIKLYPNPNNGHFTLDVTGCDGIQSISLLDMLGKKITTIPIQLGKVIDVAENLSPGIYFVSVQSIQGTIIKKVIIE